MKNKHIYLALDVGGVRIGVALADSIARIAQPIDTVAADENGVDEIKKYIREFEVDKIIVGRPRNQSGETTAQTVAVEDFVNNSLKDDMRKIVWQDESVTSVIAEERLKSRKKSYSKSDIDAEAAAIILQDYLEGVNRG